MTASDCTCAQTGTDTLDRATTFSLEFFPARGVNQLANNVIAVRQLLKVQPDFVTVTYGASGSSQGGSLDLVRWLVDAGVPVYAHLTCYAASREQLQTTIDELIEIGVAGVLAIRGDAPAEGQHRVLPHASDLVGLVRGTAERLERPVRLAVAAFPGGHPENPGVEADVQNLLRKQEAGAELAITQNFFDPAVYLRYRELSDRAGVDIPIVPGLMVPATVRQLQKMSELSGLAVPEPLASRLAGASSAAERTEIAVEHTVELATQLVRGGAPGIQLFTMNNAPASIRIVEHLREIFPSTTATSQH